MTPESRCSVLFALPVDRGEFDDVAGGRALVDYSRLLLRDDDPDEVWTRRYSRVAHVAGELLAVAVSQRARVVRRATLHDVATASADSDILVVFGHWRGWVVSERDLLGDAEAIRERAEQVWPPGRRNWRGVHSRAELANALNELLDQGMLLGTLSRELQLAAGNPAIARTLGRDVLDCALGSLIEPGNRVELYDGLHTPSEFERALHGSFTGDLDLATCMSIGLQRVISLRRGLRVRIVHTLGLIDPLSCCLIVAATFRRMAVTGETYGSARLAVEEQLREVRRSLEAQP